MDSNRKLTRRVLAGLIVTVVPGILGWTALRVRAERRFQASLAEARKEIDAGNFALARKRLSALEEERPEHPEVLYQLGTCLDARGNRDAALKIWSRVPRDSAWAEAAA